MQGRIFALCLFCLVAALPSLTPFARAADEAPRRTFWIDVYSGEPIPYEAVLDDLAGAGVIYLGERHTIRQHHELQNRVITDLARRGVSLVLGMEQLESWQQHEIDRYNRGEIDFDGLAQAVQWSKRWGNYQQYRAIVESARKFKIPIIGLNARSETIRKVARSGGVAKIDAPTRAELPQEIQLNDPLYRKLLGLEIMVHVAADEETLRPMMEAQIARDESMAEALCTYLKSKAGKGRTAIVLCGAGHVSYGLGTPDRVRRQIPQIKDRVVLMSESGDAVLSPQELQAARPIRITHEQLREINRPIADYLHETTLKQEK
jgi:uncharacterized iron-regulated protein